MNEDLLTLIQSWINKVPVIILGSGASIPFSIPGMSYLGDYIKDNCNFTEQTDIDLFNAFKERYTQTGDLETALLETQLNKNMVKDVVIKTWQCINQADLNVYSGIVSSTIKVSLSELIAYLLKTTEKRVSIITTNYDRIAEYASSQANSFINNGFTQNYFGKPSNQSSSILPAHLHGYSGIVNIWKVHGSLDWFKSEDDIKHQFPLQTEIPPGFIPSIVTPGVSKFEETHNEPYRTIFSKADNAIENAKSFLCVGYGFNDSHFQPKLIEQIKLGIPIIVLTKKLTEKAKQSIIGNRCKHYILLESNANNGTNIYSSQYGDHVIDNCDLWSLDVFYDNVFK